MFLAILLSVVGATVIGLMVIRNTIKGLPSVETLEEYVPPLITVIYDIYERPVGEFFTERRTTVPLTKIPVDLRKAVMAIEDTDFYNHWGVNPTAIFRALVKNTLAGRVVQGGSTLTQQLAKTIFLTRNKTYTRKFRELILTLQIEKQYSKDEILQLYLNQIYLGAGAYGVESASRLYFGKQTHELNLSECALVAGLIRSPNRYSPLRNPELAQSRRATVLNRMKELGFITEKEEDEANAIPIRELAGSSHAREALYFTEEIKKSLTPIYGVETLEQGGLSIHSTLNLDLQNAAQEVLYQQLDLFDVKFATAALEEYNQQLIEDFEKRKRLAKKNGLPFKGEIIYANPTESLEEDTTSQIEISEGSILISTIPPRIQGALVALDVHSGAIRAMVGGRDFFESQFNRTIQANRQPGSAFKPFVWAAALENRFTPATMVDDFPLVYIDMQSDPTLLAEATSYSNVEAAILEHIKINTTNYHELDADEIKDLEKMYWKPQNYDFSFKGPMTLRTGLQKSRNIVAVRIIDVVGARKVVNLAKQAGVTSWLNPVLSLALGTSVVNLLELTNAYATFARGGLYAEPYYIERVEDRKGNVLMENTPKVEKRLDPITAFLTTNLLRGVVEHGTGWFAKRIGKPVGGKTGTTQDQRDVWFIGFSPDLAVGVWVGYDDFRPLKKGLSASNIAVPIWTFFMRKALENTPSRDFPIPRGIQYAKIDANTGYLALSTCPKVILEAFKSGTVPQNFCPVDHIAERKEKVSQENPEEDSE